MNNNIYQKAFNRHPKYKAVKVWPKMTVQETLDETITVWIEVR